jgi:uncharacterized membrane protein YgcG
MAVDEKPWQPMLKVLVKGINTKLEADSLLSTPNNYGIEVAVVRDTQKVFCELKIPFAMIYHNPIAVSDTTKPLFFQVNIDALEENAKRPHRDGSESPNAGFGGAHMNAGGMVNSRNGMSAGGMSGGRGSMGGGGNGSMEEKPMVNIQNKPTRIQFQFRPSLQSGSEKR